MKTIRIFISSTFRDMMDERYGWIPDTVPPEVIKKEPRIKEHIGNRTSVTELEILHGVLRNPKMDGQAFFYFRDPAYVSTRPTAEQAEMIECAIPQDITDFGPAEAAFSQECNELTAIFVTLIKNSKDLSPS